MPVVKGRCARDALPHTFDIGVFKCGKIDFTTIKHINHKSGNLIDSCNGIFDSND